MSRSPSDNETTPVRRVLRDLGFLGSFLRQHRGGRYGQQHVLVALLKRGSSMTQRELQDLSRISSGALSELLAKLEGEELIARERAEADRRQLTITLTQAGEERAREAVRAWERFDGQAFSCLEEGEVEALADTLDRIAGHWRELERQRRDAGTDTPRS